MHTTNNHQSTILNSINEGVFTVDLEWRIVSFNRAAEEITGIRHEQACGRTCHEVFRTDICETACALRQTMQSGRPVVNATATIVNSSGQRIPIRVSTALLRDKTGSIIGGVETFQDLTLVEQLKKELHARYSFEDIIGRSPAMMDLFQILPQVAESTSTVLIEGASGTGKELFARAMHNLSTRKNKRFVAVNCGALPDTLLESELFGYKAGAFTDAKRDRPGRFAAADGGTIFLDEIGDISPAMQVRLLRVLQERTFEPLGSIEPVSVDARVIAATNKSLDRLVRAGKFRDDLLYRIRVFQMKIPPLRERREDIPLLVEHYIAKLNRTQGKLITGVSDAVLARLMEHDFPGNVRELQNILEHAFVLCRTQLIEPDNLPPELRPKERAGTDAHEQLTLESMEKLLLTQALHRHKGNRTKTAAALGIHPCTLYRKIKELHIEPPNSDGRSRTVAEKP
jgi:PAS domain S-box-containing protein